MIELILPFIVASINTVATFSERIYSLLQPRQIVILTAQLFRKLCSAQLNRKLCSAQQFEKKSGTEPSSINIILLRRSELT